MTRKPFYFVIAAPFFFLLAVSCSSPVSVDADANIYTLNIEFQHESDGPVKLTLENSYRKKIKTIYDDTLPSGFYSIQVDMTDDEGVTLPEGLYYYIRETDFGKFAGVLVFQHE